MQADINIATKTKDPIDVDIWYSSVYELMQTGWDYNHFSKMEESFEKMVRFQPRTIYKTCVGCSKSYTDSQCILDGKYCPYMPYDVMRSNGVEGNKKVTPQSLVEQSLREQCVYEAIDGSKSHWFRYLQELHSKCATGSDSSKVTLIDSTCHDFTVKFFSEENDPTKLVINYKVYSECLDD